MKRLKTLRIFITALLFLATIGGAAYAYETAMPLWNVIVFTLVSGVITWGFSEMVTIYSKI